MTLLTKDIYKYSPCNPFSHDAESVVEYWGFTIRTDQKTKNGEFRPLRDKNHNIVEGRKFLTRAECESAAEAAIAKAEGK